MTSPLAPPTAPPTAATAPARPSTFTSASAILIAGAAAFVWVLATEVWAKQPEMGDRFLIPLAAGAIVSRLRPRWHATPVRPSLTGLLLLAPAAFLFPAGWYLLVQVGARTLLLWWLAAALALATLGLLVVRDGWPRTRLLLFPLAFSFLALPTPDIVQTPLQHRLKALTTAGAAAVLPWLGVPVEVNGYTLKLPSGELGVVDACSGALSLTALTAISLLVAYVRRVFRRDFTTGRAIALVALTLPIVVASNTVRVIASGLLKEYVGDWAIQGAWHEALGYLVVLVGFGLILGLSQWLAKQGPGLNTAVSLTPDSRPLTPGARGGFVVVTMLVAALATCGWSEQYRQSVHPAAHLDEMALQLPGWRGQELTPPADAVEMLKCDQLRYCRYEDDWGQRVDAYVMFWATPATTAHMHHPDSCWPSRGWAEEEGHIRPVRYAADRAPLGVSVRHYLRRGQRQVVFYWTQNGRTVLPDGQEPAGHTEYAWVGQLLSGRAALPRTSRLSVLLGTDVDTGRPADQEPKLERLAAAIANDVYRLCPWAQPEAP